MELTLTDIKKGEVSRWHHPLGGNGANDAWGGVVDITMREGAQ